jgi:hypothetical protein
VKSTIVGFGTLDLTLGPRDLILRLPNSGISALNLGRQFGNVQSGKHLASLHVVTDVDVDATYVSGDLRVQFDFLHWQELARDIQRILQRRPHCYGHYGGRGCLHGCFRLILMAASGSA